MQFKNWNGENLEGQWLFTIKIDGFQCIRKGNTVVSKNGKPLYNFPKPLKQFKIAEVFCGNWNDTASIVRASKSERRKVKNDEIYRLYPVIDPRLQLFVKMSPTKEFIKQIFKEVVDKGYEGLVLRQGNTFIKVKTEYTEDGRILGWEEGAGRLKGSLGKFITNIGGCGVGFSYELRKELWKRRFELKGSYIEMKGMEKTAKGKLRNPVFIRLRPDK